MTADSSFSQPNSSSVKLLILLLVLTGGRGMPLGKNGEPFQRKAEQWSRDNDLSAKNEAPLAFMSFEHHSAKSEAPLISNHFSDENKTLFAFKRPLAEAPLAGLFK